MPEPLLLPLTVLLLIAVVARVLQGNWLSPGAFFALFWFCFAAAAALQAKDFPVLPEGLWVVTVFCLVVVAGSLVADWAVPISRREQRARRGPATAVLARPLLSIALLLAAVSAVGVGMLIIMGIQLFGLSLSFETLLMLGNRFSSARYAVEYSPPWQIRALSYWTFPAVLFSGAALAFSRTLRQRLLAFVPLVVAMMNGMIVAARSGIILAAALGTSAFLAASILRTEGRYRAFTMKTAVPAAVGVAVLFGVSLISQWSRTGDALGFDLLGFTYETRLTLFASLSVFSQWHWAGSPTDLAGGAYTFTGPADLLGLASRQFGLYADGVALASGHASNIYTLFRSLLEDFALGGALMAAFCSGLIATWGFRALAAQRVGWLLPVAIFYAVTFMSPFYSIFIFNSVTAAFFVPVIWWWVYRLRHSSDGTAHRHALATDGKAG